MDKEFSEEFMHDIADVLQYCANNNTDSVDLKFEINGIKITVALTFSID